MRSIVIAYEDQYFEALHGLVKSLRRDAGLPGIILEPRPVRGTGNFVGEVPKLLREPLKQTKLPPDRVVCVADADRPQNLVPDALAAPMLADAGALERWVLDFERSWRDFLVRDAHLAEQAAARLCVVCIRWSKESLLVASPDALLDYGRERRDRVEAVLGHCRPCPVGLPDQDFAHHYRSPEDCMDSVLDAIAGRRYKKGRDDEDLLREHISPQQARRSQVLKRCPDLARLLENLA